MGPVAVAWPNNAKLPTMIVQGAGENLVTFRPPLGGSRQNNFRWIHGRGQSTTWPASLGPVVADLRGDGRRQVLLARSAPSGSARLAATDLDGRELWGHDFPSIPGDPPVWNIGALILWQVGHFTDKRTMDVLATYRRSLMHSEETVLLSGKDGRLIWRRDRQISQRGVGGDSFALADYDGDGLTDLALLNPSLFCLMQGSTGRDILAMDALWPKVPAKPVYWGQPVAIVSPGTDRASVFFGGKSMTGLVRADGDLVWWDALDRSPSTLPACGDFAGNGRLEVIGFGYGDGLRCYDVATGELQWRMAAPASGTPSGVASADLDGDGRDEAVFALGDSLYCYGSRAGSGGGGRAGELRWRLRLPSRIGPPSIAAVDTTGEPAILVAAEDGFVYCMR